MPPLDITDAEHLKRVVVDPVIEALRAEMREGLRPVMDELAQMKKREHERDLRMDILDGRLGRIEQFKTRIAAVCSGVAVVAGVGWRVVSDWVGNYFLRGH
jgi:hypothetical protein